jgi:hypothetical protein
MTFILWLITTVLAFWEITIAQEMVVSIYARFNQATVDNYFAAIAFGNWAVFVMAIAFIAIVIGGAEYHRTHIGQPGSWRLFRWTLTFQAIYLLISFIV